MTDRPLLALIDHGAGNLVSIKQALVRAGADVTIASAPDDLADADAWVLPGVGATGAAMRRLGEAGFVGPLQSWDGPLLGICVGLQLFYTSSDEDGGTCLDLEPGVVEKLKDAPLLPHIGWNDIDTTGDLLFAGIEPDTTYYFVHSFAPVPEDLSTVIARSNYSRPFVAAIRNGNRVGVQFHPERSGQPGLTILSNFVAEVRTNETVRSTDVPS